MGGGNEQGYSCGLNRKFKLFMSCFYKNQIGKFFDQQRHQTMPNSFSRVVCKYTYKVKLIR